MNNRKPTQPAPSSLNVVPGEAVESQGKTSKRWTRIGVAFPHKEGTGFSVELRAFPVDGKLVILPPEVTEGGNSN
jgi:hypothetical protein